jgi:hypothetical protein
MPTAATVQPTAGGTQQGTGARGRDAQPNVVPIVPFIRASAEHREPCGIDVSRLLLASGGQDLGVFDISAYGYVRNIVLVVTGTGATGTPTFTEDGPFSVLQNVALTEPNGAIIAQFNSGHDLFLANKWGGFANVVGADPRMAPTTASDATGNFTFVLRIPLELSQRDGLGSLPNQNAAATFKLRMSLASGAAAPAGPLYAVAPTLQPTVRVVAYLEAWDQPEVSAAGMTNQTTPPAMNTTQFWSTQVFNVGQGFQTLRLTRVGNYIRNLIIINRRATGGLRSNGHLDFPDPIWLYLDARPLDNVSKALWTETMYRRSGFGGRAQGSVAPFTALAADSAGGLDNGVFVYDFCHEFNGTIGQENRDLWLPTLGSTRLELQGTWGSASTVTVLTNDVAIAGSVFV